METDNSNKRGSSKFFIFLFFISLGLNIFLFFRYVKRGKQLEKQNNEIILLLEESKITVDSLQRELEFTITQLEERINENLSLQDLNDETRLELETKIVELQRARNQIGSMLIEVGLTNDAGRALSLVEAKNAISKLKTDNEIYLGYVSTLEDENLKAEEKIYEKQKRISEINQENINVLNKNKKMEDKLAVASILRIGNLTFEGIQDKRSKSELTDRASRINRFKITLNVLSSDVTEPGEKKLDFRILGTNNQVLSAGNTSLMDSEKLISTSQKIDYDGNTKKIVVYFIPNEEKLNSGTYTVEVYEGSAILGTQKIQLR